MQTLVRLGLRGSLNFYFCCVDISIQIFNKNGTLSGEATLAFSFLSPNSMGLNFQGKEFTSRVKLIFEGLHHPGKQIRSQESCSPL